MQLLDCQDVCRIIESTGGLESFNNLVLEQLEFDFARWPEFKKSPRHASHFSKGVIELMPCSDQQYYSFKYVNGHPGNPELGKSSVVALGVLSDMVTGYPLMISEMTILTAIRTAATAALGLKYLARRNSTKLALIGTGAQAEFLVYALSTVMTIEELRCFDIDPAALCKFLHNMADRKSILVPTQNIADAIKTADVVVTATADKRQTHLFSEGQITDGVHIHAMGGDCPGKTELDPALLERSKIVVEYLDQTQFEGEIQNLSKVTIHAELWEIICGQKCGRVDPDEITLFDSVGVAVEDFSILKLIYDLAAQMNIAKEVDVIPNMDNPKDLFSQLSSAHTRPQLYRQSV